MILHILNLEFIAVTNLQIVHLELQYTFLPTKEKILYCDGDSLYVCGYTDSTVTEVIICVQLIFLNKSFNVLPHMK